MRGFKNKRVKVAVGVALLAVGTGLAAFLFLSKFNVAVFESKGVIAEKQRALMIFALLLSVIIVLPVFALTFGIVWKYRAGNTRAKYTPDWDGHRGYETAWWLIPLTLIAILSVITWQSSHALDPTRPLQSSKKPLTIQVMALQWKWLFLYPELHIASVNFVQFPVDTPLKFELTSDGPMNSFWIPQLGGQIYAMSGMSTHINLMANTAGDYRGSSSNISGEGFSGMKFVARASSENDFAAWVDMVKESPNRLDTDAYRQLAEPSMHNPQAFYATADSSLYNNVLMSFLDPAHRMLDTSPHTHDHRDYEVQL